MSDLAPKVIVTERPALPVDVVAVTPPGMANIRVEVMPLLLMVLIRSARTFLQAFIAALLGAAMGPAVPIVSDVLPPSQFNERFWAALYIAGITTLIAFIQNLIELLAKVDATHPEWRA